MQNASLKQQLMNFCDGDWSPLWKATNIGLSKIRPKNTRIWSCSLGRIKNHFDWCTCQALNDARYCESVAAECMKVLMKHFEIIGIRYECNAECNETMECRKHELEMSRWHATRWENNVMYHFGTKLMPDFCTVSTLPCEKNKVPYDNNLGVGGRVKNI